MNFPEFVKDWRAFREEVSGFFASAKKATTDDIEAFHSRLAAFDQKLGNVEQLQNDLSTAKQSISTLTTERDDLKSKLEASEAKQADFDAKVKEAASAEATRIMAGQGQPPVPNAANNGNPESGSVEDLNRQLQSEKDPKKRQAIALQIRQKLGHVDLFRPKS